MGSSKNVDFGAPYFQRGFHTCYGQCLAPVETPWFLPFLTFRKGHFGSFRKMLTLNTESVEVREIRRTSQNRHVPRALRCLVAGSAIGESAWTPRGLLRHQNLLCCTKFFDGDFHGDSTIEKDLFR